MSTNYLVLKADYSVMEALDMIREKKISDQIVYFYIIDHFEKLIGVLPIRKLITSSIDQSLSEIMIQNVISIHQDTTLAEASQLFSSHRYLALPVVDDCHKMVGVIDVNIYTSEVLDYARRHERVKIFELIGFRFSNVETDSPFKSFMFRLPWLFTTLLSGLFCALLTYTFEVTLEKSIILVFFTALILGLGESVSIQSMSATLELLGKIKVTFKQYFKLLQTELLTAGLLGFVCGMIAWICVFFFFNQIDVAVILGASIFVSLTLASMIGLTIPTLIHAFQLDPKIAAGPITLAVTDMVSLFFYFSIATYLLK